MSNNIEIEAKMLVNEDEYKKLLKHFNVSTNEVIVQTNHYIDSEDHELRKLGFALRIREKKDEFELTLKTPLSEGLLEKNEIITRNDYLTFKERDVFPNGSIRNFLLMLGIKVFNLKIQASLTTERFNVQYGPDSLLSIDKNIYGDKIDYEVEMEDTGLENAQNNLKDICNETNIEYRQNPFSKQARAMEQFYRSSN